MAIIIHYLVSRETKSFGKEFQGLGKNGVDYCDIIVDNNNYVLLEFRSAYTQSFFSSVLFILTIDNGYVDIACHCKTFNIKFSFVE